MAELLQDVRFATRMLRRGWSVTLVAVLSLAVAIGGNTAVFGLVSAFLFPQISLAEPERAVFLQERTLEQPRTLATLSASLPMMADVEERSRSTVAWSALRPTVVGLRDGDRSEPVSALEVQADFFDVAGISVARGRHFSPAEAGPGGARVAIVTPEFWERARGGEGEPIGSVLTLDGEPVEVVGVLPPEFTLVFAVADVWLPLAESATGSPRDRRDVFAVGRMADGATMDQVQAEIESIAAALSLEHPEVQRNWTADVFNARFDIPDARTKIFYWLLQGSVFFVLLIACANIANLLLARAQDRRREIALRSVLGAGRGRIARQLLTESGLMLAMGTVVGLALGWVGIQWLSATFADLLPPSFQPTLDGQVVLFTMGVALLAGLAFGLAPMGQALRTSHVEALKEGAGKASAGRSRKLVSRGLVVAEIALSLVALGGGSTLVRSFLELRNADPGFDHSALLTARLRVPASKYSSEEERVVFLDEALQRARGVEGATVAAIVNALPRNFLVPTDTFAIAGLERESTAPAPRAFSLKASPGYLDAIGIGLLQGRFFDDRDRLGTEAVAVVNRSFAERWYSGGDAVGRFVTVAGEARRVVGVVEDVQQVLVTTPGQVESEAIYLPAAQEPMGAYSVVLATTGDPGALKESLRTSLEGLDPDVALSQVLTMDEVMEQFFAGVNVFNTILGGFGLLAILLASVGTYGVLAYQVAQRRHEIGIRMAIGARGASVVRMVARQGVTMSVIGLALGGLVLIPLTGLLATLLEGFAEVDGGTGLYVSGLLFAVTLVASLLPALRAARLQPVSALRAE